MPGTRTVKFFPGWDKRPRAAGEPNYGVHGMHIAFHLRRERFLVYYEINTDWMPGSVERAWAPGRVGVTQGTESYSWGLGYHSLVPLVEGDFTASPGCEWLDGKPCYSGSTSARELFPGFVEHGEAWLWQKLEEYADELERRVQEELEDRGRYS